MEQEIDDKIQEFCEEDCICITTIQEEADFLPKTINEQEDVPAGRSDQCVLWHHGHKGQLGQDQHQVESGMQRQQEYLVQCEAPVTESQHRSSAKYAVGVDFCQQVVCSR